MILQAYVDDSYDDNVFVLGGYVGTVPQLQRMSDEWASALEAFHLCPELHMADLWYRFRETSKKLLEPFISIAERNSLYEVSAYLPMSDFRKVCDVYGLTGADADPYYAILNVFLSGFSKAMLDIGIHEQVDVVFDRQSQQKKVFRAWDAFIRTAPDGYRAFIGEEPRYEDSDKFMPLQAADMAAWWARKGFVADRPQISSGSLYPWRQPRDEHGYRMRIAVRRRDLAKTARNALFMRNGLVDFRRLYFPGSDV